MAGGGEVDLCFCDSVVGQDVSRGGRKGACENGGGGETGGRGDVMRTGRGGGQGEVGRDRGRVLWSGCWERHEKDDGDDEEQVREVVEETAGDEKVKGGGVEGEGGSW